MHDGSKHIIRTAWSSHPGRVRPYQEDAVLVGWYHEPEEWDWQEQAFRQAAMPGGGVLLAVADGMGGLQAGDIASSVAMHEVKKNFNRFGQADVQRADVLLRQAILDAHFAIEQQSKKTENGDMGSTLVVAWLLGDILHVAWTGDSRCYLIRRNGGLRLLTKDHSLVQNLLDEGIISEDQAFVHPQRNVITQSLGIPGRDPEPDYTHCSLLPGDRVLLCSDGLNTMLTDEEIATICKSAGNTEECVAHLIDAANEAGGHDNVSVVLAEIFKEESSQEAIFTIRRPDMVAKPNPVPRLFWLMLPMVLLLAALTIWSVSRSKKTPDKQSTPVITKAATENPIEESHAQPFADSAAMQQQPTDSVTYNGFSPFGEFVIIASGVARYRQAAQLQKKLQARYPDNRISIEWRNSLYEVRISGFTSRDAAEQFHRDDSDLMRRVVEFISPEAEKSN